jgi:hypothetical protein
MCHMLQNPEILHVVQKILCICALLKTNVDTSLNSRSYKEEGLYTGRFSVFCVTCEVFIQGDAVSSG